MVVCYRMCGKGSTSRMDGAQEQLRILLLIQGSLASPAEL